MQELTPFTEERPFGDEFEIVPEAGHRIEALINDVEVLEISRGEFDENDKERIEDKYGRT